MARLRGRCAKGERLRAGVPHGHWKTTTFVAGLRLGGLSAPMLLDGPMTGVAFRTQETEKIKPSDDCGKIPFPGRWAGDIISTNQAVI